MTQGAALAIIEPGLLEATRPIWERYTSFATEVTQGAITAKRVVDGFAAYDGNLEDDSMYSWSFWVDVSDETLNPDDYEGMDLAAFYAGITVTIVDPDEDGKVPTRDEMLATAGYVLTPAVPNPKDVSDTIDQWMRDNVAGYSQTEQDTWYVQRSEAEGIQQVIEAGGTPEASKFPMLAQLAAARGVTLVQMKDIIMAKAVPYAVATGHLLALKTQWLPNNVPNDWQSNAAYRIP